MNPKTFRPLNRHRQAPGRVLPTGSTRPALFFITLPHRHWQADGCCSQGAPVRLVKGIR